MALNLKKYDWYSTELKKKSRNYDYLTYLFMVITILVLRFGGDYRVANFLFLALALVMLILSWRVQGEDKRLKLEAQNNQTNVPPSL
jgi:hypothetical protein